MPTITPNLWFDTQAEEAAAFYTDIFGNSRVVETAHYPEGSPGRPGTVMYVRFELDGQPFVAINGGPEFVFNEAVSLAVEVDTQDELDAYWQRLTDGGEEGPCGWLKDRYGVSWQVTPRALDRLLGDDDPRRATRTFAAMSSMRKLDIAALERAALEDQPEDAAAAGGT